MSDTNANATPVSELIDLRQRILRVQALKAAKEPIPEGLAPTNEELRNALFALRRDRSVRASKGAEKKAATSVPLDLDSLFRSK